MPALIDITEKAAQKGLALLAKTGHPAGAIRVDVIPGGCSGYSYHLSPADAPLAGDTVVEAHGLKVHLPAKSLLFLVGATLDYEQTLMNQKFVFKNPNATSSCSCGESFAADAAPGREAPSIQPCSTKK
jgi:iron-sulfur cluster assembly accessory protein